MESIVIICVALLSLLIMVGSGNDQKPQEIIISLVTKDDHYPSHDLPGITLILLFAAIVILLASGL